MKILHSAFLFASLLLLAAPALGADDASEALCDDADGVTRRVAVRFEADLAAVRAFPRTSHSAVGCSRRREPSPPPPLAPANAEPVLPAANAGEPIIPAAQRYTSAN